MINKKMSNENYSIMQNPNQKTTAENPKEKSQRNASASKNNLVPVDDVKMKSLSNVFRGIIKATDEQIVNFNSKFGLTQEELKTYKCSLTDKQINSVPNMIFGIQLTREDKKNLLLDGFTPYTENHFSNNCNGYYFAVENDTIVYYPNGDLNEKDKKTIFTNEVHV